MDPDWGGYVYKRKTPGHAHAAGTADEAALTAGGGMATLSFSAFLAASTATVDLLEEALAASAFAFFFFFKSIATSISSGL